MSRQPSRVKVKLPKIRENKIIKKDAKCVSSQVHRPYIHEMRNNEIKTFTKKKAHQTTSQTTITWHNPPYTYLLPFLISSLPASLHESLLSRSLYQLLSFPVSLSLSLSELLSDPPLPLFSDPPPRPLLCLSLSLSLFPSLFSLLVKSFPVGTSNLANKLPCSAFFFASNENPKWIFLGSVGASLGAAPPPAPFLFALAPPFTFAPPPAPPLLLLPNQSSTSSSLSSRFCNANRAFTLPFLPTSSSTSPRHCSLI
ncbi:hypothetical protein BJ165DRAFT_118882 [Panaeolus papilionaceus]|nr:hypothetical protein BJ165DRAFT_118882 [Panaeolus papilionaceus]